MEMFVLASNLNALLANFCCCKCFLKQKPQIFPQHIVLSPSCHLSILVSVELTPVLQLSVQGDEQIKVQIFK